MLMAKLLLPHQGRVSEDPRARRSVLAAPPSPPVSFCSALRQMCCLIATPPGYGLAVGRGDPFVAHCIHDESRLMRGLPHGSWPHRSWPSWPTCSSGRTVSSAGVTGTLCPGPASQATNIFHVTAFLLHAAHGCGLPLFSVTRGTAARQERGQFAPCLCLCRENPPCSELRAVTSARTPSLLHNPISLLFRSSGFFINTRALER